jgi:NAD(P)-dependent dehydrogenase (short-subunit alcohol dehydrogenase family)
MDLGLAGKTALVTGASKGIGLAVAHALAAEGCSLHIAARTELDLAAARDDINAKYGAQVTVHAGSLADSAAACALAETCKNVDILVNNAGAIPAGDIEMVDETIWREAWDLKVFGYINISRVIYPAMCKRGSGVIVNVLGNAAVRPSPNYVAGAAGNSSLVGFTKALARESYDHGVRVVGINPGPIETERLVTLQKVHAQKQFGDESRWRELMSDGPGGRVGTSEECANVVAFLASDKASWVNGVVFSVDGGGSLR